jgi:hypothetical protein
MRLFSHLLFAHNYKLPMRSQVVQKIIATSESPGCFSGWVTVSRAGIKGSESSSGDPPAADIFLRFVLMSH